MQTSARKQSLQPSKSPLNYLSVFAERNPTTHLRYFHESWVFPSAVFSALAALGVEVEQSLDFFMVKKRAGQYSVMKSTFRGAGG